jgi:hypothetical protein
MTHAAFFDNLPQYQNDAERFEFDAPAFPIHCLPSKLIEIVKHFSVLNRAPMASNATVALTTLGACAGKGLRIETLPGRYTHANLYSMIAQPSGLGKSETLRPWTAPIHAFEHERLNGFENEYIERQTRIQVLEVELKVLQGKIRKGEATEKDRIESDMRQINENIKLNKSKLFSPQFLVADTTSEALARILSVNNEYALSLTAEGKLIVQNLCGRYNDKGETDEALYLKAFSGDFYRSDRISRDPVVLKEPTLACLWMLQISILRRILKKKELTEGGLLPRFLLCVCSDPIPLIDVDAPGPDPAIELRWNNLCAEVLRDYYATKVVRTISVPPEVSRTYLDFQNTAIDRMNNGLVDVQSFVARWCEIAFRIAVILHVAQHGAKAHTSTLSQETARSSIEIIQYYGAVQMQLLAPKTEDEQFARARRLYQILAEQHNGSATVRTMQRNHDFKAAEIETLAAKYPHLLKLEDIPTNASGSPKRIVSIVHTH